MCSCDDDNGPAAYVETVRTARKAHACYECGAAIAKGDRYVVCSGVWDGRPASFKWCDDCATLKRAMNERGQACFVFGDLRVCAEETLRAEGGARPVELLERMPDDARRFSDEEPSADFVWLFRRELGVDAYPIEIETYRAYRARYGVPKTHWRP